MKESASEETIAAPGRKAMRCATEDGSPRGGNQVWVPWRLFHMAKGVMEVVIAVVVIKAVSTIGKAVIVCKAVCRVTKVRQPCWNRHRCQGLRSTQETVSIHTSRRCCFEKAVVATEAVIFHKGRLSSFADLLSLYCCAASPSDHPRAASTSAFWQSPVGPIFHGSFPLAI